MIQPAIPKEAKQVQALAEEVLGDSIVGIYLFGSAVVGGLKDNSDVDVLIVVDVPLIAEQRQALVGRLMEVSGAIGTTRSVRPLEVTVVNLSDVVPWRFPPCAEFLYGEWLREAFEEGAVPIPVCDPDLVIVLKTVIDHSLPMRGDKAHKLFSPVPMTDVRKAIQESLPTLLAEIRGDERNVVLTLARMWLTLSTGDVEPKDTAAEWAETRLPDEQAALLRYARLGYMGEVDDNWSDKQDQLKVLIHRLRHSIESCLDVHESERPNS